MYARIGLGMLGAAALAVAGCAPVDAGGTMASGTTASGAPRQCFNAALVSGFRRVDERTVDLTVGANRVFRVGLIGTCPEVEDALSLGVRTRGGSSFVCNDLDVDLIVPNSVGGPRLCPATSLRQLTSAEVDAERASRRR